MIYRSSFVSNSSSSSFVIIGTEFKPEMWEIIKTFFDESEVADAVDQYDDNIEYAAQYIINEYGYDIPYIIETDENSDKTYIGIGGYTYNIEIKELSLTSEVYKDLAILGIAPEEIKVIYGAVRD